MLYLLLLNNNSNKKNLTNQKLDLIATHHQKAPENTNFNDRKKALGQLFQPPAQQQQQQQQQRASISSQNDVSNHIKTGNQHMNGTQNNAANKTNSTSINNTSSSSNKPMPPKPPPRLDLREEPAHFNSNKNSNLNFELNSKYTQQFLSMVDKPSPGNANNNNNNAAKPGGQVVASMRVTSIKYNDKYIHNHENKLVINNSSNKSLKNNNSSNDHAFDRNQLNYNNCKLKKKVQTIKSNYNRY